MTRSASRNRPLAAVLPVRVARFARQSLADRRFSPSVRVDNAAGKLYEPADRRAVDAGLRWAR